MRIFPWIAAVALTLVAAEYAVKMPPAATAGVAALALMWWGIAIKYGRRGSSHPYPRRK